MVLHCSTLEKYLAGLEFRITYFFQILKLKKNNHLRKPSWWWFQSELVHRLKFHSFLYARRVAPPPTSRPVASLYQVQFANVVRHTIDYLFAPHYCRFELSEMVSPSANQTLTLHHSNMSPTRPLFALISNQIFILSKFTKSRLWNFIHFQSPLLLLLQTELPSGP